MAPELKERLKNEKDQAAAKAAKEASERSPPQPRKQHERNITSTERPKRKGRPIATTLGGAKDTVDAAARLVDPLLNQLPSELAELVARSTSDAASQSYQWWEAVNGRVR